MEVYGIVVLLYLLIALLKKTSYYNLLHHAFIWTSCSTNIIASCGNSFLLQTSITIHTYYFF